MYDLAILGGGPGGYVAAGRAGAAGLSVVLFEKRELGGVCLNEGCIPTKTLLYSAKVYDYTRHADRYGVNVPESAIDFGAIFKRKEKVVKKLVGGVKVQMRNANVEVIKEEAVITGKEAEGFVLAAGEASYTARNILVCTGSEAAVPPIPGPRVSPTERDGAPKRQPPQPFGSNGAGIASANLSARRPAAGEPKK